MRSGLLRISLSAVGFAVLVLGCAPSANAQRCPDIGTGTGLLCTCEDHADLQVGENVLNKALCSGYLRGVTESWQAVSRASGQACWPPNGVRLADFRSFVVSYLKEHPQEEKNPAFLLIWAAMKEKYPCAKQGTRLPGTPG
jgi:Ssp1 endopeptidase immunity protein Rap1a